MTCFHKIRFIACVGVLLGVALADDLVEAAQQIENAELLDGKVVSAENVEPDNVRVTVVGPDKKPLAGAKIHASVWTKEPFEANRDFVCDENGQASVALPMTIQTLRLWARKDGHVSLFANWSEPNLKRRPIPREFTFQLEKGTTIGGFVKNEDGNPIKGAAVCVMLVNPSGETGLDQHPIPNIWLAEHDRTVDTRIFTEADGRWTLDRAPDGKDFGFLVMLNHPEYVSDDSWGGLQCEQKIDAESLRERTGTIVMPRGISLSGNVFDAKQKPVRDAVVVWGDDPYWQQGSQEVRTDANGRYRFPPLPSGDLKVTVIASGWAPEQEQVDLRSGNATKDFNLRPGKSLRLLFVDGLGSRIPDVSVSIERWRRGKALFNHDHPNVLDTQIPRTADRHGVFEWTWAPQDEVTYSFFKEGYTQLTRMPFTANDEVEYEVTLSK